MLKERGMAPLRNYNIEALGSESIFGANGQRGDTREVMLRLTGHHDDTAALRLFAMEVIPVSIIFYFFLEATLLMYHR